MHDSYSSAKLAGECDDDNYDARNDHHSPEYDPEYNVDAEPDEPDNPSFEDVYPEDVEHWRASEIEMNARNAND